MSFWVLWMIKTHSKKYTCACSAAKWSNGWWCQKKSSLYSKRCRCCLMLKRSNWMEKYIHSPVQTQERSLRCGSVWFNYIYMCTATWNCATIACNHTLDHFDRITIQLCAIKLLKWHLCVRVYAHIICVHSHSYSFSSSLLFVCCKSSACFFVCVCVCVIEFLPGKTMQYMET